MQRVRSSAELKATKPTHSWLRKISVVYVPASPDPLLVEVAGELLRHLDLWGHVVQDMPNDNTDVILTTAPFREPVRWRDALVFTARRRYGLGKSPVIFTLLHATQEEFHGALEHFENSLNKKELDPDDFAFPGLTSRAYRTLSEQGYRGGPILSLVRLVQSQAKSVRNILVVGDDEPVEAYSFDLVGAHPRSDASDREAFYEDLVFRMVTALSTHEITEHEINGDPIPGSIWQGLVTPAAMREAGKQIGARNFFTEMVRISDLVDVPALQDTVSSQYSEGCYATWDLEIDALIATITGSARPVVKDDLTDDDLAVIVGVRPDGKGALVRHVEGIRNDSPSSEAVELMDMDSGLPRVNLGPEWEVSGEVPVARSKLHGHRGVKAYNPNLVEHVYLDVPYYHYPVSCSTEAQARAIKSAFSRSVALTNPDDPRQIVFTVLPGHGVVIVEKWVYSMEPFQVMWEYMDAGHIQITNLVPQGPLTFVDDNSGLMVLQTS